MGLGWIPNVVPEMVTSASDDAASPLDGRGERCSGALPLVSPPAPTLSVTLTVGL
jgi:hypothetical protein